MLAADFYSTADDFGLTDAQLPAVMTAFEGMTEKGLSQNMDISSRMLLTKTETPYYGADFSAEYKDVINGVTIDPSFSSFPDCRAIIPRFDDGPDTPVSRVHPPPRARRSCGRRPGIPGDGGTHGAGRRAGACGPRAHPPAGKCGQRSP